MAGLLLRVGAVLSRESVDQHRLKNGLKLVVRQEKALPLVGVALYYEVGARDEVEGKTSSTTAGTKNRKKSGKRRVYLKGGEWASALSQHSDSVATMVSVGHTIWGPVLGLYIWWRRLASFGPIIEEDLTI